MSDAQVGKKREKIYCYYHYENYKKKFKNLIMDYHHVDCSQSIHIKGLNIFCYILFFLFYCYSIKNMRPWHVMLIFFPLQYKH